MTSLGFPSSITLQNLKSSNVNLKIVVTHFDTWNKMIEYSGLSECFNVEIFKKSSFSYSIAQNIPHTLQ